MKYYYIQRKLIVELSDGLAIICYLEKVRVAKKNYRRLVADMIYLPKFIEENEFAAIGLIPFSKQQALQFLMRLRAHDAIYRASCEIHWRNPKHKRQTGEDEVLKIALVTMAERHLDAPRSTKSEYFCWRKKTFEFALS